MILTLQQKCSCCCNLWNFLFLNADSTWCRMCLARGPLPIALNSRLKMLNQSHKIVGFFIIKLFSWVPISAGLRTPHIFLLQNISCMQYQSYSIATKNCNLKWEFCIHSSTVAESDKKLQLVTIIWCSFQSDLSIPLPWPLLAIASFMLNESLPVPLLLTPYVERRLAGSLQMINILRVLLVQNELDYYANCVFRHINE